MDPVLVPEPVALLEVEELLAQDAGEGGADDAAPHGLLDHSAGELDRNMSEMSKWGKSDRKPDLLN